MQFITLDNIKRFLENITQKALTFSGKVKFDNEVAFNGNSIEVNCGANMNRPVIMNGGIQVNSIGNKVSTTLLGMGENQSITYKGEELATKADINSVTVDTALSNTSTNPVQNKIVKAALDDKVTSDDLNNMASTLEDNFSTALVKKVDSSILEKSYKTWAETQEYVDHSGTTIIGNIKPIPIPVNDKYGNALIIFKDNLTVGVNSISSVIGPYVKNEIAASNSNVDLSEYAKKSTTLSGYGITDANISNGTITLGENAITPITEHQDLSAYLTSANASNLYLGKYATAYAAVKAELDWKGNRITDTYAKKTDVPAVTVSGNTISFDNVKIGVD